VCDVEQWENRNDDASAEQRARVHRLVVESDQEGCDWPAGLGGRAIEEDDRV